MSDFHSVQFPRQAFQLTLREILSSIKPERAAVLYGYDSNDTLVARAAHGLEPAQIFEPGQVSQSLLQEVLDGGQAKILVDASTDANYGNRVSTIMSGIRSVICCPLLDAGGQAIGLLYADSRVQVAAFKPAHLGLLQSLGEQLQAALQRMGDR